MGNHQNKEAIIFVPFITAFGGLERLLVDLSNHLCHNKIKHRILCYQCSIDLSSYASNHIEITILPESNNPFCRIYHLKKYLNKTSDENKGKLLIVGLQAILHFGIANLNDYGALIIDTPSLFSHDHDRGKQLFSRIRSRVSKSLIKRSLNKASWSAVMTEYIQSEVKDLYGLAPDILRPGVAIKKENFKIRSYTYPEDFHILSVSRLEKSKRIDWMFKALDRLDKNRGGATNGFSWVFDVVGSGSDDTRLKNIVQKKGLSNKVLFHGHVSPDDLNKLFYKAHLFVMPARQGYGLPAMESLVQGIPVLVHRESGVSEILKETKWAEVVDDENLVEGLERMVNKIRLGFMKTTPLPHIPNTRDWAEQICRQCGWK
ncbi:MAG: glycosyltransferase [Candidatus Edwardsbacteria bacterium]|nr:glycosyltransferase [Candidatus Edwardsbacteria bacterium]MBU2593443.1 glycosyltransferase [Candidatus Edwardsbacteria bacterium]